MFKFIYVIPIIFLILTSVSYSEGLSLNQSIKIAIEKNKDIQKAKDDVKNAMEQINQAYASAYPTLSAAGQYNDNLKYNIKTEYEGDIDKLLSLSLNQTLYSGGAVSSAIKIAKYYKEMTEANYKYEVQNVVYTASKTYFNVLLAKELLNVANEVYKSSNEHLDVVTSKYNQGTSTRYEILRSEVEVANSKNNLIAAQNAVRMAETAFYNAIGVPLNSIYELSDSLVIKSDYDITEDKALTVAFAHRLDLKSVSLSKEMYKENITINYAGHLPTVVLTGSLASSDALATQFKDLRSAAVGVAVKIPIFSGWLVKSKVKQAEIDYEKSQITIETIKDLIVFDIRKAYLNLLNAKEELTAQEKNLENAIETVRLSNVRYLNGMGTQVEVTDANTAYALARKNNANAIYDFLTAKLDLEKAQGIIDINE